GILTFKKSDALREIAKNVPHDRLLVETDAPYLAPVPHRGKRNEPAYVAHTAAVLAETIELSREEVAALTTENFFRLVSNVPHRFQEGARVGGPASADDPRLRLLAGGAAHHRRLGRVRSAESKKPAIAGRGTDRAHKT